MSQQKNIFIRSKFIETFFWLLAIALAIFINFSPKALNGFNPAFITLLLFAFLILIGSRIWINIKFRRKSVKILSGLILLILFAVIFTAVIYIKVSIVYYLLIIIAVAMAFLLVIEPNSPLIILVALCTFLLGESFWRIQIKPGTAGLAISPVFLRIFALTLVIIFSYYMYRRELKMKIEMAYMNKRLHVVDDIKTRFVEKVSHKFRTPLASIKNAADLLRKKRVNGNEKINVSEEELFDIINSNVDKQTKLVEELLDLSKIDRELKNEEEEEKKDSIN